MAFSTNSSTLPIEIKEVLQRLCAKVMAFVTGKDIQEIWGSDQQCPGTEAGIEEAIHAVRFIYEYENMGILLVEAF